MHGEPVVDRGVRYIWRETAIDTPCDKKGRQALAPPVIKRGVRLDILRGVSTIYIY